jgi:chromosome segregation ATPase
MSDQTANSEDVSDKETITAVSGSKTAAEWEAAYKGLQAAYQKLKTASDTKITSLETQLATVQTDLEGLKQGITSKDAQLGVLQSQVEKLNQEKTTIEAEKSKVVKGLNRTKLVLSDYPELASFEAQGLLPDAEDEEKLKELFGKFKDTMNARVGSDLKKEIAGTVPTGKAKTSASANTSVSGDGESEEFVYQKMLETAGRDDAAFSQWQAKYDALIANKK